MHKRAAFFTYCSYDAINSPMLNSAEYLAAQGYTVDIFARAPSSNFEVPKFQHGAIRYWVTEIPPGRIWSRLGRIRLLLKAWRELRRAACDFIVGFDPAGFQNAWLLSWLLKIPAVYHSLEFYEGTSFRQKVWQAADRIFLKRAAWLITQDAMRADWLSRTYRFPREKISVVYNTAFGEYTPQKSRYFREMFKIADQKKVVLAVGSLIQEHMILEAAEAARSWQPEFVLVIHGWFPNKAYEERIRSVVSQSGNRMFISTEFLPVARKYEVFQSADIGLVLFSPNTVNNILVGAAAGKLFEFVRCGVPVIVNELQGMRELVSGRCGVVCDAHLADLSGALLEVSGRYGTDSSLCCTFYAAYNFAGCYQKFLEDFLGQYKKRGGLL
jgi:glycosyltransferase involved in cell wall biosynthesis